MTKNARAVLKQFVEAIEQDDISPTMSTGFEKAYQNALAVLQEPDTSPAEEKAVGFDFRAHMQRQRDFSEKTFGPGQRTTGVVDHIRKELREIEANPTDLTEWIDVVILALDGAWRAGGSPEQIIATLVAKQTKNESRNWPDWRTADPNKAIEHVRTGDEQKPFEPAFDMPTTAAQALATIQRWGNPTCMTFQHSKAARAYALLASAAEADKRDAERLDWLESEGNSLVSANIPTGGDDYEVQYSVLSYHMDKPFVRTVGTGASPRAALDAAIAAQRDGDYYDPGADEYIEEPTTGDLCMAEAEAKRQRKNAKRAA